METQIFNLVNFVWAYLTIPLLLAISIVFTCYFKGVQWRFGKMIRCLMMKTPDSPVSPLQSLALALAARVGVGSLAGVALAIYLGGPGSIFWMWVSVFVTTAASFVESSLAQIYKRRDGNQFVGGPAYYIQYGLKSRGFAVIYALFIVITYTFGFSAVQMNTIATSFESTLSIPPLATGIGLTLVTAAIIFGGITAITKLVSKLIPLIAFFYVGIGLIVIFTHIDFVPVFFSTILADAFQPAPFLGGTVMMTVMTGLQRGIFSNEAGLGSGAHAAAVTNSRYPSEQGFIQAFGVYLTTLVVVTITAFLILVTDATNLVAHAGNGIELTEFAMTALFGNIGAFLLTIAIFFFAFSTVLTAYFYGEMNVKFLVDNKASIFLLRILVLIVVFVSSIGSASIIWGLVDLGTGITAFINLIALCLLSGQVKKHLDNDKKHL